MSFAKEAMSGFVVKVQIFLYGLRGHMIGILYVQDMLESWSNPFKAAYGHDAASQYYELSFVESAVSRQLVQAAHSLACVLHNLKLLERLESLLSVHSALKFFEMCHLALLDLQKVMR